MDIQTLSNLFATTYNPDPNVRKAAELDIRRVRAHVMRRFLAFSDPSPRLRRRARKA
jgi:hypothetical protein